MLGLGDCAEVVCRCWNAARRKIRRRLGAMCAKECNGRMARGKNVVLERKAGDSEVDGGEA